MEPTLLFERRVLKDDPITLREMAKFIVSLPRVSKELSAYMESDRVLDNVVSWLKRDVENGVFERQYNGLVDSIHFERLIQYINDMRVDFAQMVYKNWVGVIHENEIRTKKNFFRVSYLKDREISDSEFWQRNDMDEDITSFISSIKELDDLASREEDALFYLGKEFERIYDALKNTLYFEQFLRTREYPFGIQKPLDPDIPFTKHVENVFIILLWIFVPSSQLQPFRFSSTLENLRNQETIESEITARIYFLNQYGGYINFNNNSSPIDMCFDQSLSGSIKMENNAITSINSLDIKLDERLFPVLKREPIVFVDDSKSPFKDTEIVSRIDQKIKDEEAMLMSEGLSISERARLILTDDVIEACKRIRGFNSAANIFLDLIVLMKESGQLVIETEEEKKIMDGLIYRIGAEKKFETGRAINALIPEFAIPLKDAEVAWARESDKILQEQPTSRENYIDEFYNNALASPTLYSRVKFYRLCKTPYEFLKYLTDDIMPFSLPRLSELDKNEKKGELYIVVCILIWIGYTIRKNDNVRGSHKGPFLWREDSCHVIPIWLKPQLYDDDEDDTKEHKISDSYIKWFEQNGGKQDIMPMDTKKVKDFFIKYKGNIGINNNSLIELVFDVPFIQCIRLNGFSDVFHITKDLDKLIELVKKKEFNRETSEFKFMICTQ